MCIGLWASEYLVCTFQWKVAVAEKSQNTGGIALPTLKCMEGGQNCFNPPTHSLFWHYI